MSAKIIVALLMSLVTGTVFLSLLYLWTGAWPGEHLWRVRVLAGLVALFWIMAVLIVGLRARHFMGAAAIGVVLTGVTAFFIGGGLLMVRNNDSNMPWFSWLLPNTYAVDALRDFLLFHPIAPDWLGSLAVVVLFAGLADIGRLGFTARELRRAR